MAENIDAVGKVLCAIKRRDDQGPGGCPLYAFGSDLVGEICPQCRDDAENVLAALTPPNGEPDTGQRNGLAGDDGKTK